MRTIWVRISFAALTVGFSAIAGLSVQNAPQGDDDRDDAYTFLDRVLKRYSDAKTYHIELVEESNVTSVLKRSWERRGMAAVVLPDRRYRFEAHSETGFDVQISDGVSEWIYVQQTGQYTKGPAPISIPGPIPRVPALGLNSLLEARRVLGKISAPRGWIRSAIFLPDEKIDVNGDPVLCTVVQGKGAVPGAAGAQRKIQSTFTFWIDKRRRVICKEKEHRDGPIYPDLPHVEYTVEKTVWFSVSEPDAQSAPKELFAFEPTEPVELVKEFVSPREKIVRGVQGEYVRAVNLGTKNGKPLSLESFLGEPVLLDFWATWCAPCVESLPAVKRLYDETAAKGLVILSVDDDEDAQTATDFLAKRNEPWPNFHLTEELAAAFPEHGIPYFVLVDASGKIAYSYQGLDESGLRVAVRKLGPEFARVSEISQPKP